MHTNLDQIVRDLLANRKGDWQALSQASDVSYSWLSKFFNGHIPNPGFATLKKLHDELTKQPTAPANTAQAAMPELIGMKGAPSIQSTPTQEGVVANA